MNSTSKIIVSTLAGVGAGVLIGLLFAPDKGTETRRKIADGYNDLGDNLKTKFADLVDTVKSEYGNAKDKANDLYNKASGQTASMKGEAKDSFS